MSAGRAADMGIELQSVVLNGHDGPAHDRAKTQNDDGPSDAATDLEASVGLLGQQPGGSNSDSRPLRRKWSLSRCLMESLVVRRALSELNKVVFWKVKLWMIIVSVLAILAVIAMALGLSAAIYDDPDERFDRAAFQVPLYFNGTFQLSNHIFTEELLSPSSSPSRELADELQNKLVDLYSSSAALGRYFSTADIQAFRNGSVIAEYRLKFLMPQEHKELRNFTLSREMVFNVLLQYLYDHEDDASSSTHIVPSSLTMD